MAAKKAIVSKKTTNTKAKATTSSNQATNVSLDSVLTTLKTSPLVGALVAEFVGTFLLTASFIQMQGNPLFVAFALAGVVLIVGGVTRAHVNPAVTVGAWVTRKIDWVKAVTYIVAQLLGAGVAYLVLNTFLQNNQPTAAQVAAGATQSTLYQAATLAVGKEWYVFFAELLGVTILTLGVAAAVRSFRNRTVAAFAAGFGVLIALYVSMSVTTVLLDRSGVSLTFLNPAIALVANGLSWKLWPIAIYVIAPVLGGVFGFVLSDYLHRQSIACDCDDCN